MRYMPPFIGDEEREAALYGGAAERAALARRTGIGSLFHHKRSTPAEQVPVLPPAQPAQPAFIDSKALVQAASMGNPQAAAQLATIKLQLGKRASAGDAQAAALLQKIQGFEIQAAVAAQTQNMQAPSAAPGMPPGYGSPGAMPPGQGFPDGMPPGPGSPDGMPPGVPPGYGSPSDAPPGYPPPGYPPPGYPQE